MAVQSSAISAIADIPGLYISDISIPSSTSLLQIHSITHILSLTNLKYRPTICSTLHITHLHVTIDDNPFEDLVVVLEPLCLWISAALRTSRDAKVLVHCIEGISRSGAIVVAFLMRSQSLDYEPALQRARSSRQVIAPNSGFAEQLRVWAGMGYSALEEDGKGGWREKNEYVEWRENRGILRSKEEGKRQEHRRKEMADMVADMRGREYDERKSLDAMK